MATTKTSTFKVHKVDGSLNDEKITLCQIDPHEVTDATPVDFATASEPPRSGQAKIQQVVVNPDAMGFFKRGHLYKVTFEELPETAG